MINFFVNGTPVSCEEGTNILDAAKTAGIEIPNLCYLKELSPYGACGLCLVEMKGSPKLLRACSARPSEGAEYFTDTERAAKARKTALELLMSDHTGDCIGPCSLNCPAHTDCQKYVAQIADKDYAGATATIKEKIALPSSIGRVCPHPCETACRRQHVEQPISIAFLKSFAADKVASEGNEIKVEKAAPTGKTVGIIGAGPAGLSAAYRLALKGHKVTIYDKMPKAGGMLRYGIPEYRLPKAVLDREINDILSLGIGLKTGVTIGKDVTLDEIKEKYDAVLVCNGAWKSSSIRCRGEELDGVFGGIDFLRDAASGGKPAIGEKTAIVGGGNTAMDACRTAVRLGAKEVSVIYRRTRAEMPAEDVEIAEAEEEGVIFRFLTNPAEIIGENGRVTAVKLQVMELGEPDERGRRAPVPVEGEFITLPLDSIIIAAGQKNDPAGFELLPVTKKGTIEADEHSFATSVEGVFAAGDAVNNGASIAVNAIAQANEAAKYIDAYLCGIELSYHAPVLSEREVTKELFEGKEKLPRAVMPQRSPEERKHDFKEINLGFTEEQAVNEAKRCLSCGCHDYGECRLIKYADACCADCKKYRGEKHPGFTETRLVSIERDQAKCILCGLCVRVCDAGGKGLLGLVGRGFNTVVKPEFNDPAAIADCVNCGKCVSACPTGSMKLREKSEE